MIKLILIGVILCNTSLTFAADISSDVEFFSTVSSPTTAPPITPPKFLIRDKKFKHILDLCNRRESTVGPQKYPIFDEFHRCHVYGNYAIDTVRSLALLLSPANMMDETVLTKTYHYAVTLNIVIFGHHLKRSKNKFTRAIYRYDTSLLNALIDWISPHIQHEASIAKSYTLFTMLNALRNYPYAQHTEFITPTEMLAFLNSTIDDLYTLEECNQILKIMRSATH